MTRKEIEDRLLAHLRAAMPRQMVEAFPNAGSAEAEKRARLNLRGSVLVQYGGSVPGRPSYTYTWIIYLGAMSYRSDLGREGVLEMLEKIYDLLDQWIYDDHQNVFEFGGDNFLREEAGLWWHEMRYTTRRTYGS